MLSWAADKPSSFSSASRGVVGEVLKGNQAIADIIWTSG
jgi:hypothetical protein